MERYAYGDSRIYLHYCDGLYLFHFRGNCIRNHEPYRYSPSLRKGKESQHFDVRIKLYLHFEIYFHLRYTAHGTVSTER